MVQAEYRLFVRTAPEAEIKKRKGLKTFTAENKALKAHSGGRFCLPKTAQNGLPKMIILK